MACHRAFSVGPLGDIVCCPRMLQQQPLLLIEDVGGAIEELRRLMPGADPLQTLKYNPHVLVSGVRRPAAVEVC